MSKDTKRSEKKEAHAAGYQPIGNCYQPIQGNLDSSNPPQGGSGVSSKSQEKGKKINK